MHIVLLRLVDAADPSEHIDGHKTWLQQAFADEIFFYVGGIHGGGGGVVIAGGIGSEELLARVSKDPFVVEGIVTPEIIELDTTMSDPRLAFLVEFQGERLGFQGDTASDETTFTDAK
jgi:uncharacterized protein YciI